MWTVTRQRQWPDGDAVVEVSAGGLDYTNPDALSAKYSGEFEEFGDPRAAVETAIGIAESWQRDAPDEEVQIATGGTGGFTMPFEGEEPTDEVKAKLREWADGVWEGLPGCDQCGDKIAGDPVTLWEYEDWKFCSESCAERWHEEQQEPEPDEEEEPDEDEGADTEGGGAPRLSGAYHRTVRAFFEAPRAGSERSRREWALRELEHTADLLAAQLATFRDGIELFRSGDGWPGKRENLRRQLECIWKPDRVTAEILEIATAGAEE